MYLGEGVLTGGTFGTIFQRTRNFRNLSGVVEIKV